MKPILKWLMLILIMISEPTSLLLLKTPNLSTEGIAEVNELLAKKRRTPKCNTEDGDIPCPH